jgi:hypothetical protein
MNRIRRNRPLSTLRPYAALAGILALAWAWPVDGGEKLHGKIAASDGTKTKIVFTVQPRETAVEVDGSAGAAIGDYVDFIVVSGNRIELNGNKLKITAIQWTP